MLYITTTNPIHKCLLNPCNRRESCRAALTVMLAYDKDYCGTLLHVGSYNMLMRSNFVVNGFVPKAALKVLLSFSFFIARKYIVLLNA